MRDALLSEVIDMWTGIRSREEEAELPVKLSVVICTIPQRIQYLQSAILNVMRQNYPCELLVITDAGYSEYVKNAIPLSVYGSVRIRVLDSSGEGLSKARNRGVEASTGDIILFMDDDVVLPNPNIFFKVVEAFENDDKLGVYGVQVKPILYNSTKLKDDYAWIYGCTDDKAVRPVGAFFAVRRECFDVVGLFSENLGRFGNHLLSGEETELFNRIQKYMGLKVILDSSVTVYHVIHGRGWRYILKRTFMEGVSKARFRNYDYSAEKSYLKRYLRDFPTGWVVVGSTVLGFLVGKLWR